MDNHQSGRIVLFHQQGQLFPGIIVAERDGHFQVLDGAGKLWSLDRSRFALISKERREPPTPDTLKAFIHDASEYQRRFEDEAIKSLLTELAAGFEFPQACERLGLEGDSARFALFLYLKSHPETYKFKKDRIGLRGEEERQAYLDQQQNLKRRVEYLIAVQNWIGAPDSGSLPREAETTLRKELSGLLLEGQPKDLAKTLRRAFEGQDQAKAISGLRLALGEIDSHTDPIAAQSGIPISFDPELWRDAVSPEPVTADIAAAFTIDDEDSLDLDDAISVQSTGTGLTVGIHISNVAAQIPLGCDLYREAECRVSSLYLPSQVIPMLPPELSSGQFSLTRNGLRPVISLYARFGHNLMLDFWEFKSDWIRISGNLSYQQVDAALTAAPYSILKTVCEKLRVQRGTDSAIERNRYYWQIKATNGDVALRRIDLNSPARFIVEELMVLFNRLFAQRVQPLPLIYRNVAPYTENDGDPEAEVLGLQAYLSTKPLFHPGIGSQAYLHATSPIRRFADLVNQYQFNALLKDRALPYSREQLDQLITRIEKRLQLLKGVALGSERLWFLRFLRQKHMDTPLNAMLIKKLPNAYLAEIEPWGRRIMIRCDAYQPLHTPLKVIITAIDLEDQIASAFVSC